MAEYLESTEEQPIAQGCTRKDMHIQEKRLETFLNSEWPVPVRSLAEAGLFFTGEDDKVMCFSCHEILGNWTLGDSPWQRHRHSYPQCRHVRSRFHDKMYRADQAEIIDGNQSPDEPNQEVDRGSMASVPAGEPSINLNSSTSSSRAFLSPAQGSSLQNNSSETQSQDSLRSTADPGGAVAQPRADGMGDNWQSVHLQPPTDVRVQYDPRQALDETCPLCGLTIEQDESAITCGVCNVQLHIRCVASTQTRAQTTVNFPDWMCDHCQQYYNRNCGICSRSLTGVRRVSDIVIKCTGCFTWYHFHCIRHAMTQGEYMSVYAGTPMVNSCPNCT